MTSYQNIVKVFEEEGKFEDSLISKSELKRVLDNLCQKNARMHAFDDEVAD